MMRAVKDFSPLQYSVCGLSSFGPCFAFPLRLPPSSPILRISFRRLFTPHSSFPNRADTRLLCLVETSSSSSSSWSSSSFHFCFAHVHDAMFCLFAVCDKKEKRNRISTSIFSCSLCSANEEGKIFVAIHSCCVFGAFLAEHRDRM
jgi:hypothetical protein